MVTNFPNEVDLLNATIQQLQSWLEKGVISSTQLVEEYLERIEANNRCGLELRAVIETAPRATLMEIARELDEMRSRGAVLGDLHGIPLLLKDHIGTDPKLGTMPMLKYCYRRVC